MIRDKGKNYNPPWELKLPFLVRAMLLATLGVPELIATIPALPNASEGSLNRLSVGVPPPVLEAEEAEGRDGRAVVGELPPGDCGSRPLPWDASLRRNSTHIWENDYGGRSVFFRSHQVKEQDEG